MELFIIGVLVIFAAAAPGLIGLLIEYIGDRAARKYDERKKALLEEHMKKHEEFYKEHSKEE
jgi:Na+-translocating ferredoxin:NAD+ oxidoreductase RnfG subunit